MLKFVAAALAAAVVVTGIPTQSEAGGSRGERASTCGFSKMFTRSRVRAAKPVARRSWVTTRRSYTRGTRAKR